MGSHVDSPACAIYSKLFHTIANKIALDFETDQTEQKFESCLTLKSLLFSCPRDMISSTASVESWPRSLYKGLNDILTSNIAEAHRKPALELVSVTMDFLGVDWFSHDEQNPKRFFMLLFQLAAAEIRKQTIDKSFQEVLVEVRLITACFIIIQLGMSYVTPNKLNLKRKDKQKIKCALKKAFSGIISVLHKLSQDEAKDSLPVPEKNFVRVMVTFLAACWFVEGTPTMCSQLLPFILDIMNETFYAVRARRIAGKAGTLGTEVDPVGLIDVLTIFLPALGHLAREDEARKLILNAKEDEVLYECMNHHWSIVQDKIPPVPTEQEIEHSKAAVVTVCKIFVNISIMEAKMVEDSVLFNTLLKFVLNELPELEMISKNLSLQGTLSILGLLLLERQSKYVKKNDLSICGYMKSTIQFLWGAYIVVESRKPTALAVSIIYKEYWPELMEIWFLSMQTMSGVLAQIPWISGLLIESAWPEVIIKTLNRVKIVDPKVKSAYEDFLCDLIDANNGVTILLKRADALNACHNHQLKKLKKKLFDD